MRLNHVGKKEEPCEKLNKIQEEAGTRRRVRCLHLQMKGFDIHHYDYKDQDSENWKQSAGKYFGYFKDMDYTEILLHWMEKPHSKSFFATNGLETLLESSP